VFKKPGSALVLTTNSGIIVSLRRPCQHLLPLFTGRSQVTAGMLVPVRVVIRGIRSWGASRVQLRAVGEPAGKRGAGRRRVRKGEMSEHSAFSPFNADGQSIPARAHGAQTMPAHPGGRGYGRGTPAPRDRLLAIALTLFIRRAAPRSEGNRLTPLPLERGSGFRENGAR